MGRRPKTVADLKPNSVCHAYQEVIWSEFLDDGWKKKYAQACDNATRLKKESPDIYDYYMRNHIYDVRLPADFPPRDPTWKPTPLPAIPVAQRNPVPTDSRRTGAPPPTPLGDFTHGLRDALNATNHDQQPESTADLDPAPLSAEASQPAIGLSRTPWRKSSPAAQRTRQHSSGPPDQRLRENKSPTLSALSSHHHTVRSLEVSPSGADDGVGWWWGDIDEATATPVPDSLALVVSAPPGQTTSPPANALVSAGVNNSPRLSTPPPPITNQFPGDLPSETPELRTPDQTASPAGLPVSPDSHGAATPTGSEVHPAPRPGRRRRRKLTDATAIPAADVNRIIQTVTSFHCDCAEGYQHDIDANRDRFSLGELRRATGRDRCFPLAGERWPEPFSSSDIASTRADLDRFNYAQYLSTLPAKGRQRSQLRLRSTTPLTSPLEDQFHVTCDVDSAWMRLQELSDLVVPVELAYTAQRHLNLTGPQFLPCFSDDDLLDFDLHQTAHTLFAKTAFSVCSARVYVFWPFLKEHKKTVVNDEVCASWIDGVVMPALRTLDSCAHQDHPKSWKDASSRAGHRGEVQIGGAQGQAGLGYTLSPRFIGPLVQAMRIIVAGAAAESPLYRFRSFEFVMIVHDLKRAFNAEGPGFDAFVQFQRSLAATFRPEYLQSPKFLDRSFSDFGVEYNVKNVVAEPTTLLVRRTCIQHRFSSALLQTAPHLAAGIREPELFTAYSLRDAATGRVIPPAQAPLSSVMPMIKGYSLHKHTHKTHLRHEHAGAFRLPHLDLLCLTDDLLVDIHRQLKGHFERRTASAIQAVFFRTLRRLQEALQANRSWHNGFRIEPRLSMRLLLSLPEEDAWPSLFGGSHLQDDRQHPFVFAVATADLNDFISNYLQRMSVALAAQRIDLHDPLPAWNSVITRECLGTIATLFRIMTTFFEGDEHHHWNLRAGKYTIRRRARRRLADDGDALDLAPATVAAMRPNIRIGLLMDATIKRHGCYWLPEDLFGFRPRLHLKPHLLTRITVARPRLLWKTQINWSVPLHDRGAFEGDAVFQIVLHTARRLRRFAAVRLDPGRYLKYQVLRMQIWVMSWPVVRLLARNFFRYVASLTDQDPYFLTLEHNELGLPFNALTHAAVTRLLGVEPALICPRTSKKEGGKASWHHRLQQIFDWTTDHQWQRAASFLVELRRWVKLMKQEGVPDTCLDLWRDDLGLLMRRFVWILPSAEKKTLFRLEKQGNPKKRLRTRWYLPGVKVSSPEPLVVTKGAVCRPSFHHARGQRRRVDEVSALQYRRIDPLYLAEWYMNAYREPAFREPNGQQRLGKMLRRRLAAFECPDVQWFQDGINAGGTWVPFWACEGEFPSTDMDALQCQVEHQQEAFAPEGGFQPFEEGPATGSVGEDSSDNEYNDLHGEHDDDD